MTQYPTQLIERVQELPPSVSQQELNNKGLYLMKGLDASLAQQLIQCSREPHVVKYCPDDPNERFRNMKNLRKWQAKGRLVLPLVERMGESSLNLAGVAWLGPRKPKTDEPQIPGAKITCAVRLYGKAVGQGNAFPYIKAALSAHSIMCGNEGIWLQVWSDNSRGLGTYERIGFKVVDEGIKVRQGQERSRIYMTLGTLSTS